MSYPRPDDAIGLGDAEMVDRDHGSLRGVRRARFVDWLMMIGGSLGVESAVERSYTPFTPPA
jgi:hypothetical protein